MGSECDDPAEGRAVINELIHDMNPLDRPGYQRSLRVVFKHAIDDTVASINVLSSGGIIILRFRNPQLNRLLPRGHSLLQEILPIENANKPVFNLMDCEVRERGHSEG